MEHPFYVDGNWIAAKDLKIGSKLFLFNGSTLTIDFLEKHKKSEKVYNFEVESNHNYFVANQKILVHNNCDFLGAIGSFFTNAGKGLNRHALEHFFVGDISIGGRASSQMFKKDMTPEAVLEEASMRVAKGEGTFGISEQGAKQVTLDFGRPINETGTTSKVMIRLEKIKDGTYNVRSVHPRIK